MLEEMVERGMPHGPKYVSIEQLADQAQSIRPGAKHVKAMRVREVLDAAGLIKSLEACRTDIMERQVAVDTELGQLLRQICPGEIEAQG